MCLLCGELSHNCGCAKACHRLATADTPLEVIRRFHPDEDDAVEEFDEDEEDADWEDDGTRYPDYLRGMRRAA